MTKKRVTQMLEDEISSTEQALCFAYEYNGVYHFSSTQTFNAQVDGYDETDLFWPPRSPDLCSANIHQKDRAYSKRVNNVRY
jgi:hypothetical protein